MAESIVSLNGDGGTIFKTIRVVRLPFDRNINEGQLKGKRISMIRDFIPQKVENVLEVSYSPTFYRNKLLADSMMAFHMIDTATLGIRQAYNIQKAKYFPLPDYNVSSGHRLK